MATKSLSKLSMRLFGLPYQFTPAVDPRVSTISSSIGKKFTENIMLEAPICTIIPGEASYLPGKSKGDKITTSQAILEGHDGNFSMLTTLFENNPDDELRIYDFKNNYNEYMKYVNVLCRTGAVFLELNDKITINGTAASFQSFDWRNYRWNKNATTSMTSKISDAKSTVADKLKKGFSSTGSEFIMDSPDGNEATLKEIATNYNYVQFYVDPDVSSSDTLSNATSDSVFKSMFDQGSQKMEDLLFMANAGGMDTTTLEEFMSASSAALQSGVETILGGGAISSTLSRIINLGGNVLQGHNIIFPEVYTGSDYNKSYSITVHLRSPYGTKLGYYMNIFVPMMHLMALAMPKQETGNSYSSPFLIKAYVDGIFSCNLGIVDSISINKVSDSWSVDGLPTEVDVTISIKDLYSDLSMSPSSSPVKFINNSSLIEYIATNCGITLTEPNLKKKWENIINTTTSAFTDIPASIKGSIEESIYSKISGLTSLYK